ncbi:MAG: hypothetical protein IJK81_13700 [Selenomonadaceae bacterium]|nr:hypothetical protein [Selenomonadaceae bacterium]
MEDLVLKCAEFGILGVVTLLLLTKGLSSLTELTKTTATLSESQKALADSITKLTEKINSFSFQLSDIEKRLDKLEENSSRNFNELRNLITSKHSKVRGDLQ